MKKIIIIVIYFFIVALVIFYIKNFNMIEKKCKNNKILKYFIYVIIFICSVYIFYKSYKNINSILNYIDVYNFSKEKNQMFEICDQKIKEENKFYNSVQNLEYNNQDSKSPYIPDGFEYVEGTWDSGYVIQDMNENQYVWVPCTNIKNDEIVILEKRNFENPAFISKDTCFDEEYESFLISTFENGGFYISRYEIGNDNGIPVSKSNVLVWNNVTQNEAINILKNMYDSSSINCELINGYAYDTTLYWIKLNNEIEPYVIDFSKKDMEYTGRKKYNNIFDITDNVIELTLENSYETVIVRGFSSREELKNSNRYSIGEEESFYDENSILGFRSIIYK